MIPYKINIDLEGQREITSNVTLSVGDVEGYGLVLEFYRGGKPYDITGYNLSISALPSGATLPIPDIGTVEGGRGYYLIKPSMYAYAGNMRLEVILSDGRSSTVTKVIHFPVRSGFSSFGGSIVEEKDFTVLQELILKAQLAISQAETVVQLSDETKSFAEEARASAQRVADTIKMYGSVVEDAYIENDILYIKINDGETFAAGHVRGAKGDTGNSGVHIGSDEPIDPEIKVWIDPAGNDGMQEIINILSRLKYTNGAVEVDLSDYATIKALENYATKNDLNDKVGSAHKHAASDITSGILPVARGGTGNSSVDTTPKSGSTKMVTSGGVYTALSGKATSTHKHAASDVTSGILPVARGGVGRESVTANSFLVGAGAEPLAEKTPAEVLTLIGAAASGHTHTPSAIGAARIQTGTKADVYSTRYAKGNLSFNFAPKLFIVANGLSGDILYGPGLHSDVSGFCPVVISTNALPAISDDGEPRDDGIHLRDADGGADFYMAKSEDGKTLMWDNSSAYDIFDFDDYYWVAIG